MNSSVGITWVITWVVYLAKSWSIKPLKTHRVGDVQLRISADHVLLINWVTTRYQPSIIIYQTKISCIWGFPKMGYPQIIHFNGIFPYKPPFVKSKWHQSSTFFDMGLASQVCSSPGICAFAQHGLKDKSTVMGMGYLWNAIEMLWLIRGSFIWKFPSYGRLSWLAVSTPWQPHHHVNHIIIK